METDVAPCQLRDRATRGESLTAAEQAQLAAWYTQQDIEEGTLLTSSTSATSATSPRLRGEVKEATERLLTVTQRIQSVTEENEALRRDIATLSERLARTA